jgi:hypothetical protein
MIVEDVLAMFGVSCFVVGSGFALWLTWVLTRAEPFRCIECGGEIAPVLERLGSLRCHECR